MSERPNTVPVEITQKKQEEKDVDSNKQSSQQSILKDSKVAWEFLPDGSSVDDGVKIGREEPR